MAVAFALVICGIEPPRLPELVLAPIKIPALATRAHELDQIIDEYADEARVALQISTPLKTTPSVVAEVPNVARSDRRRARGGRRSRRRRW